MKTKPFFALRPAVSCAKELASVPYDVVNSNEAAALAAGNPISFLHVSRPEIDLPEGTDIYSDEVYAQAKRALNSLIEKGALEHNSEEKYYAYRQIMGTHAQTGIVALCNIDDYAQDIIKKHEKTRQDKEDDRTRHVLELMANTGPVFLTYKDLPTIDAIVKDTQKSTPLYDFTADDGIRHTVWEFPQEINEKLTFLFEKVPASYVADGHHRAKAAFRAGTELRAKNGGKEGDYCWFLAVLFPASELAIMAYNRVVADLNGLTDTEFMAKVQSTFTVKEVDYDTPKQSCEACMYLDKKWYSLTWEKPNLGPVASLDVSILQDRLLAPILAIVDPRTSKRISFVGGIRGTQELTHLVDSGKARVAFSMAPVTVNEMMAIADAGEIMPPKSTWFEPKLRSGLLIHEIQQ